MGSLGALMQGALTVSVQQAFGWNALFYVFFALALLACVCLVPVLRPAR
jgi:sugar phosphate permease